MCSSVWSDSFLQLLVQNWLVRLTSQTAEDSHWSSRRGCPGGGAAGSTCLPAALGRGRPPSVLPACRPPPTAASSSSTPRRKGTTCKVVSPISTSSSLQNITVTYFQWTNLKGQNSRMKTPYLHTPAMNITCWGSRSYTIAKSENKLNS